jgi:multicomponent Na+:H+ antiporter subunit A
MFLGGKTTPALTAAMTFFLVHSLYKSSLFLVVGIIDHQTGTRQMKAIGGLIKPLPMTAFAAATAALSMAGFPLFFGFIGKEIMYKGALTEEMLPGFATLATLLSNSLMTAVAGAIAFGAFLGPLKKTPRIPKEAPWMMWIGPVFMGTLDIVFGIVPEWVARWLIEPAVRAFHGTMEDIKLQFFYGINEPLLLSMITLILGSIFYLLRQKIKGALASVCKRLPLRAEQGYGVLLEAIARLAAAQTRILQNGSLHRYLAVIIGSVTLGIGLPFCMHFPALGGMDVASVSPPQGLVVFIIAAGIIVVVLARSRLLAICGLGVVGAGSALLFLIFGAPDVALTQLLVETLTVIIASLVLLRLPRLEHRRSRLGFGTLLNAILAVAAGTVITALMLAANRFELDRYLTAFFEANSYVAAHGRNIVNVILVDFRSLDTLGEITVLAAAGLAGYALIRFRKKA